MSAEPSPSAAGAIPREARNGDRMRSAMSNGAKKPTIVQSVRSRTDLSPSVRPIVQRSSLAEPMNKLLVLQGDTHWLSWACEAFG
jgi:hypothetical protein